MNYKDGKWAKQILNSRNDEGMWGDFHTLIFMINALAYYPKFLPPKRQVIIWQQQSCCQAISRRKKNWDLLQNGLKRTRMNTANGIWVQVLKMTYTFLYLIHGEITMTEYQIAQKKSPIYYKRFPNKVNAKSDDFFRFSF